MDGPGTGKMEGRPIDTIGYRGMHSYEIALENWFVSAAPTSSVCEDGKGNALLPTRWPGSRTAVYRPPHVPSA